jgi:hypothetical protein
MKTTLNTSDIARALKSDENAAWTWNGAKALAEYLEQLEEETGEEMELDVCAVRCDFSEYANLMEWGMYYFKDQIDGASQLNLTIGTDGSLEEEDEEIDDSIRSHIRDKGTLIEFDGGVIVSCF